MRLWAEMKDFIDLMLHPSRRIERRAEKERKLDLEFQMNIREAAMFSQALDGDRDWRFP